MNQPFPPNLYEYTYIMQSKDGMLHVAYAYQTRRGVKWLTVSEEGIIGAKRGDSVYNPTSGEIK